MVKPPLKPEKSIQRGDIDSSVEILSPTKETLKIKGKISYNESDQAFTLLKFRKEVVNEYPHLKEKNSPFEFVYLMKLHRTYQDLKREIELLEKEEKPIPFMLSLGVEKSEEANI